MPTNLEEKIRVLLRALNFENEDGMNTGGLCICVTKIVTGVQRAANTFYMNDDDLNSLVHMLSQGWKKDLMRSESIEAIFIPVLRDMGAMAARKGNVLDYLSKKLSPIQKDSLFCEGLMVGSIFMSRYRIDEVTVPSRDRRIVELKVTDQIPPKDQLLIRLLYHQEFDAPHLARNFTRESALLSKIEHSFIAKIRNFGRTSEYLYQIQDHNEGVPLSEFLKWSEPGVDPMDLWPHCSKLYGVGEVKVIRLLLALLEGLDLLHDRNIVHTNIVPENIIVNPEDFSDVKLINWELARWDSVHVFGHSVGVLEAFPTTNPVQMRNPYYLAPEILTSGAYTTSAWDLYALGAVAFACVYGSPPFADRKWDAETRLSGSKDKENILQSIVTDPIPDVRVKVHACNDFVEILERMLEKDPEERITSTALREQLEELLSHLNSIPESMRNCLPHLASGSSEMAVKTLDLREETRTDFICRYLAKFATELSVNQVWITGGLIPLDVVKDPSTKELILRELKLASHDIMVIASSLNDSSLTHLDLYDNAIAHESHTSSSMNPKQYDYAGLRRLTSSIQKMPLQVLDFSKNALGVEGGILVANTLKHMSASLVTLKLGFCHIMPEGGLAIAKILHTMTELKTLDLSHCYIGDSGTIAVARALENFANSKLDWLSLFSNNIDNEGGTALMATLESNFTLLSLSLGDNSIPEVHNRVVQRVIGFNNQYLSLKLRNDKFDGFGHNLMAESLKTWGRGNMFIAQRLLYRLQRPRDALEESVARILLTNDGASIILDEHHVSVGQGMPDQDTKKKMRIEDNANNYEE